MAASLDVSQSVEIESLQADSQLRAAEAGTCGWGQFRNPEEGEHLPFEAATNHRSVTVICEVQS
jgi:hypothetical protein